MDLGTAKGFSVLAGSGITNTGMTHVAGSLGTYETPTVTTDTPFDFTGADAVNHAGDGVTQTAKSDLLSAYNMAAGALPPTAVPEELARTDPYLPGIYRASSSMLLSGAMTLDGGGRKDGVFIFQAPASTLTTASNATVRFVNGAQPCNVYWQVGSSATFGTGTSFVGNVLAHTSISAKTGAVFEGRLLANNGAVTLDTNTISAPTCDTTPDAGTDTDTQGTDAGTDTGTDADATDTGTDTDSEGTDVGTDTAGTDAGTNADTGTQTDSAADSGTDTGGGTGDDVTTPPNGSGTEATDTDLPDTGGPNMLVLTIGFIAILGGVSIIRLRRTPRATHRA
ncbi:ice-binding family protein [Aeromicrobium ginsengisoli]|uniref:DUF3494 domain-containing protein n=1 Tax=Aeromicrobium ginsengisoli TaxID=363867 RepID=A0A5M4FI07_9ACTN|nr:ice-binding family protein [Aeromicrobium ginsengisoli]KAA1399582.1 DUF3494 domain-containing protein [Aeromicrobium ginsengisoli]